MAEYKAIHGTLFQHKTSDPLATGASGATWASGGALNLGRSGLGGAGIQTAVAAFGGYNTAVKDETEQYNGSSWTEVGDLNTAKYKMGDTGTTTAAMSAGGKTSARIVHTELWDNSSWTESGNMNTARQDMGAAGTTTAAIVFAGSAPGGNTVNAETFAGSS